MNVSTRSVWLSDFWSHTAVTYCTLNFSTWLTMKWSIEDDSCQPVDGFTAEGMSSQRLHWVGWQQLEPSMPEPEQNWTKHFTVSSHSHMKMLKEIANVHLVNSSWTCFNASLHVFGVLKSSRVRATHVLCFFVWWIMDSYLHTPNYSLRFSKLSFQCHDWFDLRKLNHLQAGIVLVAIELTIVGNFTGTNSGLIGFLKFAFGGRIGTELFRRQSLKAEPSPMDWPGWTT